MIGIDERYETLYDQWCVEGEPMGSFAMFIFAEYERTFAEVKRLREGIVDVMVKSGHYGTTSEMVKALGKVIE